MPYTAYIAAGAFGIIFDSPEGILLFFALVSNELLNHLFKFAVKTIVGKTEVTKRPAGAKDTGIYPQHFPKESTSMGMPSGHGQTSGFLATVLIQQVLLTTMPAEKQTRAILFIVTVACMVMLSLTQWGGIFSVHVNGQLVACHTVMQVVVGGFIGILVGLVGFQMYLAGWAGAFV